MKYTNINNMEEFISNFEEFRSFLNDDLTEIMIKQLVGTDGISVLKMIKDKFNELGLNEVL